MWGGSSFVFPCHALECSAIHLPASCSVRKPLITSVSPSGHRISISQPVPGFFRAKKVGRCSNILRICACGGPVQDSYPATIKLTTSAARRPITGPESRRCPFGLRARSAGCSRQCRARQRCPGGGLTSRVPTKSVFLPQRIAATNASGQQRGSIMVAFILNSIYRQFLRSSLPRMRKVAAGRAPK